MLCAHDTQDDLGQQDGRESSVICVFLNLNEYVIAIHTSKLC